VPAEQDGIGGELFCPPFAALMLRGEAAEQANE
jgi:hypothetical protein